MKITPLEEWIGAKIGLAKEVMPDPASLHDYQLTMLKKSLTNARMNSPFYQRMLKNVDPHAFKSMADIASLLFASPEDLAESALEMLCVSQGEISRGTTLQASGTTGKLQADLLCLERP